MGNERIYGWVENCQHCSRGVCLDGREGNEIHRIRQELPDRRSGLSKLLSSHDPSYRQMLVCGSCLESLRSQGWEREVSYRRYKAEDGLC